MDEHTLAHLVAYATIIQGVGTIFVAAAFLISLRQTRLTQDSLHQSQLAMARADTLNQMAQYQSALQLMFDWRSDIIDHPTLANGFGDEEYFEKAFSILPKREYFHTIKLLHIFEHDWLLHNRKVIHDDIWMPWSRNITLLMRQKKKRQIWELASKVRGGGVFNKDFVAFVDDAVARADASERSF